MQKCLLCQNKKTFLEEGSVILDHPSYDQSNKLLKCSICGFCLIYPPPDEKHLSEIYSGIYHYDNNFILDTLITLYASIDLRSDIKLINKYRKSGKILDIGAGRGDLLLGLDKKWEKWAHDPYLSNGDIKTLKGKIGKNVNIRKRLDEYEENYYDVVVLRNIIEHTLQFRDLIKNSYRMLKKGGVLFIRTPNIESTGYKNFGVDWYVITYAGHIVFFNCKNLSDMLKKTGFNVKYCAPTDFDVPLTFYRSSQKPKGKLPRLFGSLLFSLYSAFIKSGTDLRSIAKK